MILDKELKYLLVGWVLGLASSLIVDWIRKRNQKDEFKKAVVSELKGLKFVLVGIVSRLSERIEKLDKNLLDWMNENIREYKEGEQVDEQITYIKKLATMSEEEFNSYREIIKQKASKETHISLKQFSLPFLDTNLNSLSLLNLQIQGKILHIRTSLYLINQQIDSFRFFYEKTFDPQSAERNMEIFDHNINGIYRSIFVIARNTVNKINSLIKEIENEDTFKLTPS